MWGCHNMPPLIIIGKRITARTRIIYLQYSLLARENLSGATIQRSCVLPAPVFFSGWWYIISIKVQTLGSRCTATFLRRNGYSRLPDVCRKYITIIIITTTQARLAYVRRYCGRGRVGHGDSGRCIANQR